MKPIVFTTLTLSPVDSLDGRTWMIACEISGVPAVSYFESREKAEHCIAYLQTNGFLWEMA